MNKSCIGAGKPKCNGKRLHSTKYNGKKLYCEVCIEVICARLKLMAASPVRLAVR